MPPKSGRKIVIKPKVLENTGYLMAADGKQFIIAGGYKIKAVPFGEVAEWGGTIATIAEVPMDVEYVLCLEPDEDNRSGRISLESVKQSKQGQFTVYRYTFKGISALT